MKGLKIAIILVVLILIIFGVKSFVGDKSEAGIIKIGAIHALSGDNAIYGEAMQTGINLAVKEANEAGGINGRKVEVLYEDHRGDPAVALSAYTKLKDQEGVKVISASFSNVILALAPKAQQDKILIINSGATAEDIIKQGNYLISTVPTASKEVAPIATYASKKYKTAGIIYVNYQFGIDQRDAFKKSFEENGGKVVISEGAAINSIDFRSQLSKIKLRKPDVIFIATLAKETTTIIKQAKEFGLTVPLLTTQTSINVSSLQGLGATANGLILSGTRFNLESDDQNFSKFRTKYKAAYQKEPDYFAATYYESTKMLVEALKTCVDNSECLSGHLLGLKNYSGILGTITFIGTTVDKPMDIKQFVDGELKTIQSE